MTVARNLSLLSPNVSISGTVNNTGLTNNGITINGTTVALGSTGTVTAAAGTLTGTTLNSTVTTSSLTSVGTLGNLTVTGAITANGGISVVDSIAYDYNFTGTTSSTTATAITTFPIATYRSGKLLMQVVNSTAYRILELLVIHNGTTVTLSENYAVANEIQTAATNTTFTASIAAGTLTIFATASSGTSVVKGHATLFKV